MLDIRRFEFSVDDTSAPDAAFPIRFDDRYEPVAVPVGLGLPRPEIMTSPGPPSVAETIPSLLPPSPPGAYTVEFGTVRVEARVVMNSSSP